MVKGAGLYRLIHVQQRTRDSLWGRSGHFQPLATIKVRQKRVKGVITERFSHIRHQYLVMTKVVNSVELGTQHFITLIQMMQISAREVFAGVAITALIDWARIIAMLRIP